MKVKQTNLNLDIIYKKIIINNKSREIFKLLEIKKILKIKN